MTNYTFKNTLVMTVTAVDNCLWASLGSDQGKEYYDICDITSNGTNYGGTMTIDIAQAVINVQNSLGGQPVNFSAVGTNWTGPGQHTFNIKADGVVALNVNAKLQPFTSEQWACTFQHVGS